MQFSTLPLPNPQQSLIIHLFLHRSILFSNWQNDRWFPRLKRQYYKNCFNPECCERYNIPPALVVLSVVGAAVIVMLEVLLDRSVLFPDKVLTVMRVVLDVEAEGCEVEADGFRADVVLVS